MNTPRIFLGSALAAFMNVAAADSSLFLAFTPDPSALSSPGAISPEGCYVEYGEVDGLLAQPIEGAACHSGRFGPAGASQVIFAGDIRVATAPRAVFTSAPFVHGLELDGATSIRIYYVNEASPAGGCAAPCTASLEYGLFEVHPNGEEVAIASGVAIEALFGNHRLEGFCCHEESGTFDIGTHQVSAGSRLRLYLSLGTRNFPVQISAGNFLFGGDSMIISDTPLGDEFGDAGITFAIRDEGTKAAELTSGVSPEGSGLLAGATPVALLIPFLTMLLARRKLRERVSAKP